MMMSATAARRRGRTADMPDFSGAVAWINSPPLNRDQLKGHVVLVDFWTYSCINCLRSIPYVRAWAEKYKDSGPIVIGVHTPEFAFEKDLDNVRRAVSELKITYPVALDNDYKIWKAFNNSYWPADYLIDAKVTFDITISAKASTTNQSSRSGTAQGTQPAIVSQRTGESCGDRR